MKKQVPLLTVADLKKSFGEVSVLRGVTFSVYEGECLALMGENGAGKSTLMKILSGVWPYGSFEGELTFSGEPVRLSSTIEARRLGISMIHQELCLFPKLTVSENIFLTESYPYDGSPSQKLFNRVHWQAMKSKAKELLNSLDFNVPCDALVESLSIAQKQLVEIAKAIHQNAKLLILDEPTSALSRCEVENLFSIIKSLRERKMSFIYISHKLDEVLSLSDRIVVLRDGLTVQELYPAQTDEREVIHHMVGRKIDTFERGAKEISDVVLFEVKDLSHSVSLHGVSLEKISFQVLQGEILGISGLMGSGRSELLRSITGLLSGDRKGEIYFAGNKVSWSHVSHAMADGVVFIPEDRKSDGLFLDLAIGFNISISSLNRLGNWIGILDSPLEHQMIEHYKKKMNIKINQSSDAVRVLSGGNQQKVLLTKMIARSPKLLLVDEPTRGVDVGAKEEIYKILRELVASGLTIVMVSSELPELLALSDRILVLKEGKMAAILENNELTQQDIMYYAAGAGQKGQLEKSRGLS